MNWRCGGEETQIVFSLSFRGGGLLSLRCPRPLPAVSRLKGSQEEGDIRILLPKKGERPSVRLMTCQYQKVSPGSAPLAKPPRYRVVSYARILPRSFNDRPARDRYPLKPGPKLLGCAFVDIAADIISVIAGVRDYLFGCWIQERFGDVIYYSLAIKFYTNI